MFLRAGLSLPSVFGGRLCRVLFAAALAALCCAPAAAQTGVEDTGTGGNHTIQGRIVFPSGRRADVRLKVRLQSSQSGELSVFTDNNGSFAFRSLGAGTYTVVIEGGEDFQTVTESVYIEPEVVTMITGMPTMANRYHRSLTRHRTIRRSKWSMPSLPPVTPARMNAAKVGPA